METISVQGLMPLRIVQTVANGLADVVAEEVGLGRERIVDLKPATKFPPFSRTWANGLVADGPISSPVCLLEACTAFERCRLGVAGYVIYRFETVLRGQFRIGDRIDRGVCSGHKQSSSCRGAAIVKLWGVPGWSGRYRLWEGWLRRR